MFYFKKKIKKKKIIIIIIFYSFISINEYEFLLKFNGLLYEKLLLLYLFIYNIEKHPVNLYIQ